MHQMNKIEGLGFQEVLRTDVTLYQNSLKFHERLFLYEYGKMLLYEHLQYKGLLSPHVSSMCLRIETNSATMEIKVVSEENIAVKSQVHVNQV